MDVSPEDWRALCAMGRLCNERRKARTMRIWKIALVSLALLAVSSVMVGCDRSNLRIGWRETNLPRQRRARYRSFDGLEQASFRAEAGEEVVLDYSVEVREGGLVVSLLDPNGERMWSETFREGAADVRRFTAPDGGRYHVWIEGVSTRGGFDISWRVGEA